MSAGEASGEDEWTDTELHEEFDLSQMDVFSYVAAGFCSPSNWVVSGDNCTDPDAVVVGEWLGSRTFAGVKETAEKEEGDAEICPINYHPLYRRLMGIFRTLHREEEISYRMLNLTTLAIAANSANYSVWEHRRRCIDSLPDVPLQVELDFTRAWSFVSRKNYQVWWHRRWIVAKVNSSAGEMEDVEVVLNHDAKNYKAWAHRLFICRTFGDWSLELPFVDRMIRRDPLNNSAWNHRRAVLDATMLEDSTECQTLGEQEIKYSLKRVLEFPWNECAWNYLFSFFYDEADADDRTSQNALPWRFPPIELQEAIKTVLDRDPKCRFALRAKALVHIGRGDIDAAEQVYTQLREIDGIREHLWAWKISELRSRTAWA